MHSAISINTLCLGKGSFREHVAYVERLGANAISPTLEEVLEQGAPAAAKLLADSGLSVATVTHSAFAFATRGEAQAGRERLDLTIALAASIHAQSITLTTGGRGALSWPQAAETFAAEIAPCARHAREAGITLSLEPTSHLYADVSIAHRLRDAIELARRADISVGIDLFACWLDADIEDAISTAGSICALVQVSDYVYGDRGLPCRAVPGDGAISVRGLITSIAKAGYRGFYDLEIIGPRLAAGGLENGLRRAADFVAALL